MTDPFAILGLPRRFDLAPAEIQRAYLALVAEAGAHPDFASDGMLAEERSAELNRARATLVDAEKRAAALHDLWSRELAIAPAERADTLPPAFLMEMMDVREQLEAAQRSQNAPELRRWEQWAARRRTELRDRVASLFQTVGSRPAEASSALREVKLVLNQWRYIERMMEQVG